MVTRVKEIYAHSPNLSTYELVEVISDQGPQTQVRPSFTDFDPCCTFYSTFIIQICSCIDIRF